MRLSLRMQLTLLYAVPFFVSGGLLISIPLVGTRVSQPVGRPGPPDVTVHTPIAGSVIGLAAMGVVSLLLGWLIAGRFLRPLRTIIATARDISATKLNRRIKMPGSNEFADLGASLDELFARLEWAFESQGHFIANASHELRTPLTAQRALMQVALADPDATVDTLRATGREVLALGEAQERLIDSLLTLATSERGIERHEPLDLAEIAAAVLDGRAPSDVRIETRLAPAPTSGDPQLVEVLVANLVDNALRYNVPGGFVEIATDIDDLNDPTIWVRNTGPVVPPEELNRLFQPFQQLGTQRVGDGHGLGLAIVWTIAIVHTAVLTSEARPDGGLNIEVNFRPWNAPPTLSTIVASRPAPDGR